MLWAINLYIGSLLAINTFEYVVEKFVVFCVAIYIYGRIGEIPHGRLRMDWGNTTQAATAGLGSKGLIRLLINILDPTSDKYI